MSSVLPAPAGFASRETARHPLAGFSRRHALLAVCFAVLTPSTFAVFGLAFGERLYPLAMLGELARYLVLGLTTACCAIASDNLLRHRVGPVWALAIALLTAAVISTAVVQIVSQLVIAPLGWDAGHKMESKGLASPLQRIVLEFVGLARWSLVLVALYELLESNHRAGEELHAARMTALASQQNLVEGELRAMQARVDPELLFNSLVTIDEGYAHGVEAGQQRLDSLIRFLRAALPSDFGGTSTVAREQELVEAYVALLNQRGGDPLQLAVSVDPGARGEQMPSMLLLPLVRWAAASTRNVRTRIGRRGAMLAIEVESDARKDEAAPAEEIMSVRDRIGQLYAESAQLVIEQGRARLEIPRQATARSQA